MARNWAQDFAEFRRVHDLSQRDLAEALGVSEKTVWNVEHGKPARFQTRLRFHEFVKTYSLSAPETIKPPIELG